MSDASRLDSIRSAKAVEVIDPEIAQGAFGGPVLWGQGEDAENEWPLVWTVAQECGIAWGAGNPGTHQIHPGAFVMPRLEWWGWV